MEKALYKSFLSQRERNVPLSADILRTKISKEEKHKSLELLVKEAKGRGERIETRHTVEYVQDTIKKLKASIKQYALVGKKENLLELQQLLQAKEHSLYMDKNNYDTFKLSIELLEQTLRERFDFVKKLRVHMSVLLKFTFAQILKARNFDGGLDLDFKNRKLELHVIPRPMDGEECVSSTRALSGGEHSYSTVAFLLSLWSCVDHPFFFLDEYDVFTDEVNREYMTRLLIAEGKKHAHRQFVFLTPLDMTIAGNDFVKIHKMAPAKR